MKKLIKGINDLESQFPKVAKYWDYDNNDGKKPCDVFAHSNESANWKCPVCGYTWPARIANRTRDKKGGCPACSGKVLAPGINDLETTHPEIAKEWDYELNYPKTPRDVMHGTLMCIIGFAQMVTNHIHNHQTKERVKTLVAQSVIKEGNHHLLKELCFTM